MERVHRRDWHAIARVEQIAAPGDFLTLDLFGEPLVAVRGADHEVRVFSRVCRHRFADVTADREGNVPECGKLEHFECPYHMWSYRLNGELINAVDMQRRAEFAADRFNLVEFDSAVWQGFVFVKLDNDSTAPLGMEPLSTCIGHYDFSEWRLVGSRDWGRVGANWKMVMENFMEFYHHMGAHLYTVETALPGLSAEVGDGADPSTYVARVATSPAGADREVEGALQPAALLPPPEHFDTWDCGGSLIFSRFPTFMVAAFCDFSYWYQLTPTSAGDHELKVHALVHESNLDRVDDALVAAAYEFFAPIQEEDAAMTTRVQKNMTSGAVHGGVLHDQEFPLLHMQRYLAGMLKNGKA
ncbi:aromatic ring-hydroxylating dioxygenase subunit alpha [Streptomyces sp. NPDC001663]|uniref:aromatic ring-hydroxylating oxygenase subunit alpha n=1 Tax=Streptomyces sp. NPDC001663 TaxID=3364597 RepID=UPI00367BD7A0